jgi:hypothetical protein
MVLGCFAHCSHRVRTRLHSSLTAADFSQVPEKGRTPNACLGTGIRAASGVGRPAGLASGSYCHYPGKYDESCNPYPLSRMPPCCQSPGCSQLSGRAASDATPGTGQRSGLKCRRVRGPNGAVAEHPERSSHRQFLCRTRWMPVALIAQIQHGAYVTHNPRGCPSVVSHWPRRVCVGRLCPR